jgi:hypothetical protein
LSLFGVGLYPVNPVVAVITVLCHRTVPVQIL